MLRVATKFELALPQKRGLLVISGCYGESGGVGVAASRVRSLELVAGGERLSRVMSPNGPVASSGYAIEGREALALFGRVAEVVQFKELEAAASQACS